jgi:hypothetical protein
LLLEILRADQEAGGQVAAPWSDLHGVGDDEEMVVVSRYQILARLLKELRLLSPTFAPRRIVDFGCGSGGVRRR